MVTALCAARDTAVRPVLALSQGAYEARPLNVWAVLHDRGAAPPLTALGALALGIGVVGRSGVVAAERVTQNRAPRAALRE